MWNLKKNKTTNRTEQKQTHEYREHLDVGPIGKWADFLTG